LPPHRQQRHIVTDLGGGEICGELSGEKMIEQRLERQVRRRRLAQPAKPDVERLLPPLDQAVGEGEQCGASRHGDVQGGVGRRAEAEREADLDREVARLPFSDEQWRQVTGAGDRRTA
jgi:uncharacterized caspase-like protein